MIEITCPKCRNVLECPESMEGQIAACPSCAAEVLLQRGGVRQKASAPAQGRRPDPPGQMTVAVSDFRVPFRRVLQLTFYVLVSLFLIALIPVCVMLAVASLFSP